MTDCRGCGQLIPRSKPTDRRVYHSPACRPRCAVADCGLPVVAKGWCPAHARRAARTGDPIPEVPRNRNRGRCSVDNCDEPMRKRTWCAGHYSMWARRGVVEPFGYKWSAPADGCVVCGEPRTWGKRLFCSARCDRLWRRHNGQVPDHIPCVQCGTVISLARPKGAAQRRRADTKTCRKCRQDRRKHGLSVNQLATRDGTDCGICHEPVDMGAARTDKMRPSVDHVWPRGRGGTNDPTNLQLAHLLCNQLKKDHVPSDRPLGVIA